MITISRDISFGGPDFRSFSYLARGNRIEVEADEEYCTITFKGDGLEGHKMSKDDAILLANTIIKACED